MQEGTSNRDCIVLTAKLQLHKLVRIDKLCTLWFPLFASQFLVEVFIWYENYRRDRVLALDS